MTGTSTSTWTGTFTRSEVIAFQIRFVVESTTKVENFGPIIEGGVIENEWIEIVQVHGIDDDEHIHAQITMRIDWERHRIHVQANGGLVAVDQSRPPGEQLSQVIGAIVSFFSKKMEEKNLRAVWSLRYRADVDRVHANRVLGLSDRPARDWVEGERIHAVGDVPPLLDEFSIDLSLIVASRPEQKEMGQQTGVVKWFSKEKGFGFIVPDNRDSDVFVHYSQIEGGGFRFLEAGQRVRFEVETHVKGKRAVNVRVL